MNRSHCPPIRSHPTIAVEAHQPTTGVLLEAVLDAVELAVLDGYHELPLLLSVRRPGSRPRPPELHVKPLPHGTHPADGFAGFTAPHDWFAVGCAAGGTKRSLDSGEPLGRATFGFLLHRDGTSVLSLSGQGREIATETEAPPQGLVPDTCRRVLGLATPPPEVSVERWLSSLWLEEVFAAVVADPAAQWTWDRLLGARPVTDWDFMDGHSWEELRLEFTRFKNTMFGVDAELAAWMDTGMFARALGEAVPPSELLLADLQALLSGPVHAQLTDFLR